MNRFCKSTLSLLLAVLLLFSAAGISLGMVFQSTRAYAVEAQQGETPAPDGTDEDQPEVPEQEEQEEPETPQEPEEQPPAWSPKDQTINIMGGEKKPEKKEPIPESEQNTQEENANQKVTADSPPSNTRSFPSSLNGKISDATFAEKSIRSVPIKEGFENLLLKVYIEGIDKTILESYKDNGKINFDSAPRFIPNNPSNALSLEIDNIQPKDDGVEFTAKIPDVEFSGTSSTRSITFSFTFDHGAGASSTFSEQIELANTPGDTTDDSIAIYNIRFSKNGKLVSRVTRGNYDLIITVRDFRIKDVTKTEEFDQLSKVVVINEDVFYPSNEPYFSFLSDLTGKGIEYEIRYDNIFYSGLENTLYLGIGYPETNYSATAWFDRITLPQCEIYEPEPDDNNNNYPDDDDDHDSSSSKPDIPPPTPNIIVSTYDYGGGNVTAAGNFTLSMTLMNTSKRVNVDNVVMKLGVPEAFTLTSSSNTFYIERIAKRSSVERTVNLSVKPNAEAISHPIKVSFTYEAVINDERKQFSAEQDISIPVSQLDRFSLNPVEVPSEIYVGEDTSIEATFVNKGKSTVYNVTAEITGNLSQPGQRQFIGNVESGKEESADFLIGALEAGAISGEVVISYEDANMNVNELRSPFTTTAISFDMPEPDPGLDAMNPGDIGEAPPEPWYQQVPIWGWMVGGVAAIILLSFTAKAIRRRRDLKLLEDSDEDF